MKYPSSTAIYISHVDGAEITNNTIHNTSYSGISCGWGWNTVDYSYAEKINLRNVVIAYNSITDVMQLSDDGGAIYVLGANCTVKYATLFNEIHHNYAEYVPGQCRFKTGYYLDGSSSNWHIYDNVSIGPIHPLYTQYGVTSQHAHNVLNERLYADHVVNTRNHDLGRNVIVEPESIFKAITSDKLYERYPQAYKIAEESGSALIK